MNKHQSWSAYQCPVSGSNLSLRDDTLCTDNGEFKYPVRDNVPIFLASPSAESKDDEDILAQLTTALEGSDRVTAIKKVYENDPRMIDYVTNKKREKYLNLVDFHAAHTVLEIGSGLGQFTVPISQRVKEVYALDVVEGQTKFLAKVSEQDSLSNVHVACGGDQCLLPYQDDKFDSVILNLVLEWCGARSAEPHEDSQRRLIREINRVLKPGGQLYLATKNRYSIRYLIGASDEHVGGMRFGNALPRWMLKLALKVRGKPRPNGFLHSHNKLKEMLAASGFEDLRAFWAAPEVRFPDSYIELTDESIKEARKSADFKQGSNKLDRFLMPLIPASVVKHVTQGHAFVAKKASS